MTFKFSQKKLSKRTKDMMKLTESERDLLNIYEKAIGSKMVINEDLDKVHKVISKVSNGLLNDLKIMRKKSNKSLADIARISQLEDNINENLNNFELVNRLLFIQDRVKADKELSAKKTPLIAPFWMNYCGEKTKIAENIRDNVEPTDRVDALCKQHDIDFDLSKTPQEARKADIKLLKSLDELGKDKSLTTLERFNRNMIEFMISSKKTLEDVGVLPMGSFADADKIFDEGDIKLMRQSLQDTSAIETEVIEFINEKEGISDIEFENILEELISEKGGMDNVLISEYRDKAFERIKDLSEFSTYGNSKLVDNYITDIYIKRQNMPPTTKSERAKVRAEVDALIKAKTNIEDYPSRLLKKGSITNAQLSAIIVEHNAVRVPGEKLNRKTMRIKKSGGIEKRIQNIVKVADSLSDGIQDDEKANLDDTYMNYLQQKKDGVEMSKEMISIIDRVRRKMGRQRQLKLEADFQKMSKEDADLKKEALKYESIKPIIKKDPIKSQIEKLNELADGLISRPSILAMIRDGSIDLADAILVRTAVRDLTKKLGDSNVSFEPDESIKFNKLINDLERQFESLPDDMTKTDFDLLSSLVNIDVKEASNLIDSEVNEEARQRSVIEEKEEKQVQPQFEEKQIQPSFSLQQKGDEKGDVATTVETESQQSASAVNDSLKTSTDRSQNTLPRNRRPFFFTLGTDLITKTEEENEEDIETFANFSWIPTDGNFYNGVENTIARATRANDILRYDLNNQFGGLWMPEAPQPIFQLTPSVPLYDKLRVSLAPDVQHEQERVPINSRAKPGKIKLYAQNVLESPGDIVRNNIENRDIFPNVVDGIRV